MTVAWFHRRKSRGEIEDVQSHARRLIKAIEDAERKVAGSTKRTLAAARQVEHEADKFKGAPET